MTIEISRPITATEQKSRMGLNEFAKWLKTEDGLRARCIEMGYAAAHKCGLLKELHLVRTGNQTRAWLESLEIAKSAVGDSELWRDKVVSFAEDAVLSMGYAPPHWTFEQVENWLKEHPVNLES